MTRTLETRLRRLEMQVTAGPPGPTTPYVHPRSPPSEAWWEALGQLLETSPYREAIMAHLTGEGEEAWPGV